MSKRSQRTLSACNQSRQQQQQQQQVVAESASQALQMIGDAGNKLAPATDEENLDASQQPAGQQRKRLRPSQQRDASEQAAAAAPVPGAGGKSKHADLCANLEQVNTVTRAAQKRPQQLNQKQKQQEQLHQQQEHAQEKKPEAQQKQKMTDSRREHICAACARPIRERYLLMALDKHWHEDCLKCACCDCRLGEVGSSLFTHSDMLLCRRDFLRIFGQHGHCAACKRSIPPYELVMRANELAYHMDCFACQQCQYRFCVGDRFHLIETHKILCLLCHTEQQQQSRVLRGIARTPADGTTSGEPSEEAIAREVVIELVGGGAGAGGASESELELRPASPPSRPTSVRSNLEDRTPRASAPNTPKVGAQQQALPV